MNVILAPVLTEKTVEEMKKGKYTFIVARYADKPSIKRSVEESFGVNVLDISTVNRKETKRRTMQGRTLRTKAFKKATVKLKSGQKIDIFNIQK